MKRFNLKMLIVVLLLAVVNIKCNPGAKLLKSDSPLMTSLGGVPNLSTLTRLMQTPGLDKALGNVLSDPFTLLAPTNEAFDTLGTNAMTMLTNPANVDQVAKLLRDHNIAGKHDAASIVQFGLKTVSGKTLDLGGAKSGDLITNKDFNILPINKVLGS